MASLPHHGPGICQLRASAQQVLQLHPKLLLAGGANRYPSEVMVVSREASCESTLRVVIPFMPDFGLIIFNSPGIPMRRAGFPFAFALASLSLVVGSMLVHDGASCGYWPQGCLPSLHRDCNLFTPDFLAPHKCRVGQEFAIGLQLSLALRLGLLQWVS